jgi:hypothetical protein
MIMAVSCGVDTIAMVAGIGNGDVADFAVGSRQPRCRGAAQLVIWKGESKIAARYIKKMVRQKNLWAAWAAADCRGHDKGRFPLCGRCGIRKLFAW